MGVLAVMSMTPPARQRGSVFVAGATGVLGIRAVKGLLDAGHRVTALSRSAEKDELLRALGADPVRVSLFDVDSLTRAVAGHDVVINLATRIPPADKAFRRRAWADNDRIRTEASRNLAAVAASVGATRLIQESLALLYADSGAAWIDESSPTAPTWHTRSALAAEENALQPGAQGITAVVLRFASLYAPDASHTRYSIASAARGNAPLIGSADAYYSMLHAADAAAAVVAATSAPAGIYNVVEDEPLTRGELLGIFAGAAGRRRLRRVPSWLARIVGGEAAALLMRSQRVSNRKLRSATGWAPRFSSARTGWADVVAGHDDGGESQAGP